jgi:hypothetical protein
MTVERPTESVIARGDPRARASRSLRARLMIGVEERHKLQIVGREDCIENGGPKVRDADLANPHLGRLHERLFRAMYSAMVPSPSRTLTRR